jgi:hypothetical protein
MAALDFPNNPVDGEVFGDYIYDANKGVWNANALQRVARFVVSDTPPSAPVNGDAWFDTTEGTTYIYYNDGDSAQWVETGNPVLSFLDLDRLTDVELVSPAENEALVYNGTKWSNTPISTGFEQQFLLMGA